MIGGLTLNISSLIGVNTKAEWKFRLSMRQKPFLLPDEGAKIKLPSKCLT